ncbi:MAG: VCBS repeat-containing protein [Chryseolinea sp.]
MIYYYLFIGAISALLPLDDSPKFKAQVVDSDVSIGYGLAIGDVDGDKKPDILLADKQRFVWYRNGDWKRFVLVENLTASDNVCIAARDIDGDGKVEIAVGGQWNPGETSDTLKSGSVHYLIRPSDPTQPWTPVKLHHEPTVHRMKWVKIDNNKFHLVVLPLHGRGNKDGNGRGVRIFSYEKPKDAKAKWKLFLVDSTMHLTHNFDVMMRDQGESLYIGGKEGAKIFNFEGSKWSSQRGREWVGQGNSFGEIRIASQQQTPLFVAAIEPMHGNFLSIYNARNEKIILASDLNQGHALGVGDLLGKNSMQIVAGWREPDTTKKTGIKIFVQLNVTNNNWSNYWIDDNEIACEDLQLADLDGDGKKEIIASGRATHNLKIYWNKN